MECDKERKKKGCGVFCQLLIVPKFQFLTEVVIMDLWSDLVVVENLECWGGAEGGWVFESLGPISNWRIYKVKLVGLAC